MRKAFIPCLALCAILAACTREDANTNVIPDPVPPKTNTGPKSDSADYFIKASINGAPWECRGVDATVVRKHVGTGNDTLTTYSGQANVAGTFMQVYVRMLNFTDTGFISYPNLTLEVRHITSDQDYNKKHIYTTKSFNIGTTWADIEHDNDTTVNGVFSGMVYTNDLKDSIEVTWGSINLKW